jgi:hypothetical protein
MWRGVRNTGGIGVGVGAESTGGLLTAATIDEVEVEAPSLASRAESIEAQGGIETIGSQVTSVTLYHTRYLEDPVIRVEQRKTRM